MNSLRQIFKLAKKNNATRGMTWKEYQQYAADRGITNELLKAGNSDARKLASLFFYGQPLISSPQWAPIALEAPEILSPIIENDINKIKTLKVPTLKTITTTTKKSKNGITKTTEEVIDYTGDFRGIPQNSGSWKPSVTPDLTKKQTTLNTSVKQSSLNTPDNRIYTRVGTSTNPAGHSGIGQPQKAIFTGLRFFAPLGIKGMTPEYVKFLLANPDLDTWGVADYVQKHPEFMNQSYMRKQGGKMTYKFQQGGQASSLDAVMQFVQALAQTLQADPNQVILAAQLNPDALKSAVQVYQQTLDIQQAAQAFSQALQSQAQAAKHGAKLNYLKALKNQCAEDEELVYFKKGGKVDCGCRKKDGGEIKEGKKESAIDKFKKMAKGDKVPLKFVNPNDTVHVNERAYSLVNSDGSRADSRFPAYKGKVEEEDRKKAKAGNKDSLKRQTKQDLMSSEKKGGNLQKDCGGSKMKLKKGDKVCPKCGKVHAAGMGCSVAKFKYRKLGGQL